MSTLLVTRNEDKSVTTSFEDGEFLGEGDLTVDVSYSSLNYKDAMALSGNRGILRNLPMVPGIDVVGTLDDGTLVTVNGRGIGDAIDGHRTLTRLKVAAALAGSPGTLVSARALQGVVEGDHLGRAEVPHRGEAQQHLGIEFVDGVLTEHLVVPADRAVPQRLARRRARAR